MAGDTITQVFGRPYSDMSWIMNPVQPPVLAQIAAHEVGV
jgi:hypothetical protein